MNSSAILNVIFSVLNYKASILTLILSFTNYAENKTLKVNLIRPFSLPHMYL